MKQSSADINRKSFCLGVADFSLRICCNHPQLTNALADRYSDFPPKSASIFIADIEWVGSKRSSSLLDTNTKFQDDILTFSAPGYYGFIDEKSGYGKLQLSSAKPIDDIDYFLRIVIALLAHKHGGVLLHTAGIVRHRKAYLFFGHSGSGKTTICKESADDDLILNDDLILLIPTRDIWLAYSTPFWNISQVKPFNHRAPIAGLYYLIQDKIVYKKELPIGKATAALISNIPVIPQDPHRSRRLLDVLGKIQHYIPVYELHFLPDNSFWDVITS